MYAARDERWGPVDELFTSLLVGEDDLLRSIRSSTATAGLPAHEVAPNQGALLALLTRMVEGRRVLEIGTLAGYSTIWFARAVGPSGHVMTLEVDPRAAHLAKRNLVMAGVDAWVEVMVGAATTSLTELVEQGTEPYDVVFIDADKPNNPAYLQATLQLTRPGSLVVADNVVRDGAILDRDSGDARVRGVRAFLEMIAEEPRLEATALQTVGVKGWDGFVLARVRAPA
ncbi:O-methyltransferase [Egicoccus sp. AB-alg2]|uniref:O-methyltransferase n=1 Tax=Egicoccus sp. AB-alg2 TaxID=3242693 RepID=UPI00359EDEB8